MGRSIESRLEDLENSMPRGYTTFDGNGEPVIQSDLPALEWYMAAMNLLQSKGHQKEKYLLRAQLSRSTGDDNGGGRIYELIAALADPYMTDPHREDRLVKPFGRKVRSFNA